MNFRDLVLLYLKQRSVGITFSNNQLLSLPAEYNVLLLRYSNLYASTDYDNALQGTSGVNRK